MRERCEVFLQEFNDSIAWQGDVCVMIEEYLLHPSSCEGGRFLWLAVVCMVVWNIWARGMVMCLEGEKGTIVRFGLWWDFMCPFWLLR